MRIGVPNESRHGEALVATTPDTAGKLIKLGYDVVVESGAGERAAYPDQQYVEAGASIVSRDEVWTSDIVVTLDTPQDSELDLMARGATLVSRLAPKRNEATIQALAERGLTGLSMDMVPRISRAQSMDVLSSMANLAGYRAVIEAANAYGRLFSGQVTAAGKMPPANVYVIGAGVAGLAAIGTAHSMGAQVFATDVREETAEQVESMGGSFVAIPVAGQKSEDGYAKEMTADQAQAAAKLYAQEAAKADIVITTANIPGRTSPILLDDAAVAAMKPGSVIVDMAAANGGNVTLTRSGEAVVTDGGVTIIGYSDLAGRLPGQASQLYGQNLVNFFKLTTPEKDGVLNLDLNDEVVRQMAVTVEGEVFFPPPPVKVSAAPAKSQTAPVAEPAPEPEPKSWLARYWWALVAAVVLGVLIFLAPPAIASHFMVFALAVVVGFYVITNVTHSLHTPLMSVTNAISGIIVVGAILQVGANNVAVQILAAIAVAVASINVFGGFAVTERMLKMFRRS
ncbi:NAD(P) transhydrogenase subunit alpha [Arcanobacterium wilhelmae]|uniref:proton-translocating NAD(P)(+) transhydrogenase n=1 Tax=Arcanobacterium wilhelmae TaxID=1803177 RepID=A0ABT9ND94_9ACTO|nr:Re/Si-specific NAD(P)(+) transhydrogenase subunit alpha [Arcanobacterium wilhelmae]MDP9801697.1 NAD(P) transhydrogenase subunit alpha [Arcanobacterium wilhelmae]WFN91017.1 Re/Si-specific NAD(P)(+) transhydrogenase subunit alpha [Arcanobacterium wilhelmae]